MLYVLIKKSFDMPVRERKQKSLKVWNFALYLVLFKRHHGGEGVNSSVVTAGEDGGETEEGPEEERRECV